MPRDIAALAQLFPVLRQVESVAGARRRLVEAQDVQEQRNADVFHRLLLLLLRLPGSRFAWQSLALFSNP